MVLISLPMAHKKQHLFVYFILVTFAVTIFVISIRPNIYNIFSSFVELKHPSFPLSTLTDSEAPSACFGTSTTLEQLVVCFDDYLISPDYYDLSRYNDAQPNTEERTAWRESVASLLATDNNCSSVIVPSPIADLYSVTTFTESSGSYCVLSESASVNGMFSKGWGLMVVPATHHAVSRFIHISAPHPSSDLGTTQQAAALFKSSGAKSLLIPGRLRMAFREATDCIPSPSGTVYYKTDPTHDKLEPFYDANEIIWTWQEMSGGCPSQSCAFIQLHGKGPKSCPSDHMFLSSGLGHSPSSDAWYADDVERPIKRLHSQLKLAFPTWNITLPSESSCFLTATSNVVGRLLNGIDDSRVCVQGSNARLATGVFIHVEQASAARAIAAYEGWSKALTTAFKAVYDTGV